MQGSKLDRIFRVRALLFALSTYGWKLPAAMTNWRKGDLEASCDRWGDLAANASGLSSRRFLIGRRSTSAYTAIAVHGWLAFGAGAVAFFAVPLLNP